MAVSLGWFDDRGRELMTQELVVSISGQASGDVLVLLQSTFRPAEQQVTLGQSNFGLLGLRTTRFGELVQ